MKVVYTFQALQDLRDIYDYIAFTLLSPDAARNTTERILEAARGLQSMPEKNPLYKEEPWHSQGVRFIPVKNYIVFYCKFINGNRITCIQDFISAFQIQITALYLTTCTHINNCRLVVTVIKQESVICCT
jgi:toxin ParE1/3/4